MKRCPLRRRGFWLIELLSTLIVLTIFAEIAAHVFSSTMRVMEQAPTAHEAMIRFESASSVLRQDAWDGRSFSTGGTNVVQIGMPDQRTIRWEIDSTGNIVRTADDDRRRWIGAGREAVLEVDGPCIVLRSMSRKADAASEVRCVSLLQLAAARGEIK